jgi:hypothetical protein
MQTDNGYFRNFMSYTKSSEEERGWEDSFGRTIMALGYLVNEGAFSINGQNRSRNFFKSVSPY